MVTLAKVDRSNHRLEVTADVNGLSVVLSSPSGESLTIDYGHRYPKPFIQRLEKTLKSGGYGGFIIPDSKGHIYVVLEEQQSSKDEGKWLNLYFGWEWGHLLPEFDGLRIREDEARIIIKAINSFMAA